MNLEKLTQTSEDEIVLTNIVEDIVMLHIHDAVNAGNLCGCKICQLNACAIALNSLQPKYVTSSKGVLLAKINYMNSEANFQIVVEVSKALKIVKENPMH